MRTIRLTRPLHLAQPVVTVGTFDGVHVGHRAVLDTVCEHARSLAGTAVAVSFAPHPLKVIDRTMAPRVLTTLEEKAWRMADTGLDVFAVVGFTPEVRDLTPTEFVEKYLVEQLGARAVVVGYDHGFGRDRSGGGDALRTLGQTHGFDVMAVPPTLVDGEPVSSTRVRRAVLGGDLEGATSLMGAGYPIVGRVVSGAGRGRKIGVPTANLSLPDGDKLVPGNGVYAGWAHVPEPRRAVVNLGVCPTFQGTRRTLEVHVLDYGGELKGTDVAVELTHRIRDERKFSGSDDLVAQIRRDVSTARRVLHKPEAIHSRR